MCDTPELARTQLGRATARRSRTLRVSSEQGDDVEGPEQALEAALATSSIRPSSVCEATDSEDAPDGQATRADRAEGLRTTEVLYDISRVLEDCPTCSTLAGGVSRLGEQMCDASMEMKQ